MKRIMLLAFLVLISGCSTVKESSFPEDQLVVLRKYVGDFIEFRHTGIKDGTGPNIIWIKTSQEEKYGKISAYGKNCDFKPGDRLYLRRILFSPGMVSAFWEYYIENDSLISYKATDFQHDKKTSADILFY